MDFRQFLIRHLALLRFVRTWTVRLLVPRRFRKAVRLQLFFPEGIAFDGFRFNRTAVTAPLFRCLEPDERAEESLASPTGFEPVF